MDLIVRITVDGRTHILRDIIGVRRRINVSRGFDKMDVNIVNK